MLKFIILLFLSLMLQAETIALQNHEDKPFNSADTLKIDINCDVHEDIIIGINNDSLYTLQVLLLQQSVVHRTIELVFQLSKPMYQSGFCGNVVDIKQEDLDYDPAEIFDEPFPGFRRSKSCKAFRLEDGMCDSFHFFWNYQTDEINFWRL